MSFFCEHDHGCVFVKNANLDGCSNVGCVDWFVENTAADYAANKKNWSQILLSAAAFAVSFLSLEHKTEVCHFFQLLRRHFSFKAFFCVVKPSVCWLDWDVGIWDVMSPCHPSRWCQRWWLYWQWWWCLWCQRWWLLQSSKQLFQLASRQCQRWGAARTGAAKIGQHCPSISCIGDDRIMVMVMVSGWWWQFWMSDDYDDDFEWAVMMMILSVTER